MSPSEPSASGAGRRRKSSESDVPSAERSSAGRRRSGGRRKKESQRRSRNLFIAAGALLVVLIVLGAVLYVQLTGDEEDGEAAVETRPDSYRVVDTGNMNEVLASREVDGRALNESELFERRNEEISSQNIDFALRDSELSEDCLGAAWGEQVQEALTEADCSQAGRATYVADDYFGAVSIFNLETVEDSRDVAATMTEPEPEEEGEEPPEDPGFVLAPSGDDPFDRLGEGYSAGEAIISGHYLVVVWVQPIDSDSAEERVTLSSPLVALANFRDPLYRRMVEVDGGGEPEEDAEEELEEPEEPQELEEEPVDPEELEEPEADVPE